MAKKAKKRTDFPSKVTDLSLEQLLDAVDRRIASGEVPWPLVAGPTPWPYPFPYPRPPHVPDPWPPRCPVCGSGFGYGTTAQQITGALDAQSIMPSALAGGRPATRTVTVKQIWRELKQALVDWKSRYADVEEETELDTMAASGNGRFDVLSAVRRSDFFNSLGLVLHYFQIGGDEDLGDVVETIAKLLGDLGHMVTT